MTEQPRKFTYLYFYNMIDEQYTVSVDEIKTRWPNWSRESLTKLIKKHGFELLFMGSAFGSEYMNVLAVKTDKGFEAFMRFLTDFRSLGPVGLTKTIIVPEPL